MRGGDRGGRPDLPADAQEGRPRALQPRLKDTGTLYMILGNIIFFKSRIEPLNTS